MTDLFEGFSGLFDFADDFVVDALEGMTPEEQQEVLAEMEAEEAEFRLEGGRLDLQRMTEEMGLFQKFEIWIKDIFGDFFEDDEEEEESTPKKELKAMAFEEWEDKVSLPKKGPNFFLEAKGWFREFGAGSSSCQNFYAFGCRLERKRH